MELLFILTVSFCIMLYSIQCATPEKLIIFDFDETLGYFSEMNLIVSILYSLRKDANISFRDITRYVCRLYPEYFRKDIFQTLECILKMKKEKHIHKVIMYTNNNAGKYWVESVLDYIHYILQEPLFDEMITSYNCLHQEENDTRRISQEKQIADLNHILHIHPHSEFVFIDDSYHKKMESEYVCYIKINPYIYTMGIQHIIQRLRENYYDQSNIDYICKQLELKYYQIQKYLPTSCSSHINNELDMERIILNIDLFCTPFILV